MRTNLNYFNLMAALEGRLQTQSHSEVQYMNFGAHNSAHSTVRFRVRGGLVIKMFWYLRATGVVIILGELATFQIMIGN